MLLYLSNYFSMAKSSILIMLSLALSFSMIAPTINSLLDLTPDSSLLDDFSEEESSTNEKEVSEKDIVLLVFQKFEPYCPTGLNELKGFYTEGSSMFHKKILLPPPKRVS